jgi:hypothetical protein
MRQEGKENGDFLAAKHAAYTNGQMPLPSFAYSAPISRLNSAALPLPSLAYSAYFAVQLFCFVFGQSRLVMPGQTKSNHFAGPLSRGSHISRLKSGAFPLPPASWRGLFFDIF